MKVVIIYRIFSDNDDTRGILLKQQSQSRAFQNLGYECDVVNLSQDGIHLNGGLVYKMNFKVEPLKSINLFSRFFASISDFLTTDYDLFYIRYSPLSLDIVRLARKIRKVNKHARIILDFPTFPFIEEYHGYKRVLAHSLLNKLRNNAELFDKATVLDNRQEVCGIPSLSIKNGIDVNSLPLAKANEKEMFKMIFVGNLTKHQGLDRVLRGLEQYRGPKTIELKIIGAGSELERLQRSGPYPKAQVTFLGSKYGAELDRLIDGTHIGVGKLGMHRMGFKYSSGIKHRDYCARGLPFIYSCNDEDFDGKRYVKRFSADDGAIKIGEVIDYFLNLDPYKVEMRNFAEQNLTWELQMEKIIDKVKP